MAKPKSPVPAVRALLAYAESMDEKSRLNSAESVGELIVDLCTDLVHLSDMHSAGSGEGVLNQVKLHYNAERD